MGIRRKKHPKIPKFKTSIKQTVSKKRGRRSKKAVVSGNVETFYRNDALGDHYNANIKLEEKNLILDIIGYNQESLESVKIDRDSGFITIVETEKDGDMSEIIIAISDIYMYFDDDDDDDVRDSESRIDDIVDKYDIDRVDLTTVNTVALVEPTGEFIFAITDDDEDMKKLKRKFDRATKL